MGYSLKLRNIKKIVKVKGNEKVLLDNVSFDIGASQFVAIVGVSGAGKTTLLNVLSGYAKYNQGNIFMNDRNISSDMDYYRNKISYVPQKEILHNHLTLKKSLYYSASLRMPKLKKKERLKKVEQVILELELNGRENTLIKNLSGGERKRASIALELLTKPDIMFLDEPTSGLDSNIEKKLMRKLKEISESGKTIVITAHTVSNLYLCDKIIFMSEGGKIAFVGNYEESLEYFQVEEFVDIYEKLKNNKEAVKYQKKYEALELKKINIKENKENIKIEKVNIFKEIYFLTRRYIDVILNNKMFSFLLFAQAVIMGIAVITVAGKDWLQIYDKAKILIFAFSCAAMWLGLFNSVQEIVKEKDILKLEYFNNMRISSYVFSKLIVFAILALIQAFLFIGIISLKVNFPRAGIIFNSVFMEYVLEFFMVAFASSMLGMFISAVVKTTEITLILSPIYMMFQLLFSGILVALEGIGEAISYLMIGRYAVECMGVSSNLIEVLKNTSLGGIIDTRVTTRMFIEEANNYYTYTVSHFNNVMFILGFTILLFVLLAILAIRFSIRKSN